MCIRDRIIDTLLLEEYTTAVHYVWIMILAVLVVRLIYIMCNQIFEQYASPSRDETKRRTAEKADVYKRQVLGDAMFYGSGAGKLPTASAVVADVVEMAKNLDKNIPIEWSSKKLELVDYREWENRFFIRTTADKVAVERVFGTVTYVQAEGVTGELGFVTEKISEGDCEKKEAELGNILQKIRVA